MCDCLEINALMTFCLQMGHYKSNKICPFYEQNKAAKVPRLFCLSSLSFCPQKEAFEFFVAACKRMRPTCEISAYGNLFMKVTNPLLSESSS